MAGIQPITQKIERVFASRVVIIPEMHENLSWTLRKKSIILRLIPTQSFHFRCCCNHTIQGLSEE
jgi:hypothetical protein